MWESNYPHRLKKKSNKEINSTCFSISLVTEYRSNLISVFCMYSANACKLWISVIIRSWIPGCWTYYTQKKSELELHWLMKSIGLIRFIYLDDNITCITFQSCSMNLVWPHNTYVIYMVLNPNIEFKTVAKYTSFTTDYHPSEDLYETWTWIWTSRSKANIFRFYNTWKNTMLHTQKGFYSSKLFFHQPYWMHWQNEIKI